MRPGWGWTRAEKNAAFEQCCGGFVASILRRNGLAVQPVGNVRWNMMNRSSGSPRSALTRLRDLTVLLVVIAAFAVSLALIGQLVGLASPWFGLTVMLDFLGIVAFARPLLPLRLPPCLRREREWEISGRLHRLLRVPTFGLLLRRTPLRHLNPLVYLKQYLDPAVVQTQLESAEAAHTMAAVLLVLGPLAASEKNQGSRWLSRETPGFATRLGRPSRC